MNIKEGDVLFCYDYMISNDTKASRHSIIAVVVNDTPKIGAVICTGQRNAFKYKNTVDINYADAGLRKPTVAICSKLLIVDRSYVDKIIGHVRYADFCKITNAVAAMETQLNLVEDIDSDGSIYEVVRQLYRNGDVLTLSEMMQYLADNEDVYDWE